MSAYEETGVSVPGEHLPRGQVGLQDLILKGHSTVDKSLESCSHGQSIRRESSFHREIHGPEKSAMTQTDHVDE